MLNSIQLQQIADSLNMSLNDFAFASAISGILSGFTFLIIILYLISNNNTKG